MTVSNFTKRLAILLCILNFIFLPVMKIESSYNNSNAALMTNEIYTECIGEYFSDGNFVTLTTFPVDIDRLFWAENASMQALYLNNIGNYSYGWMLTPWGSHFVSRHTEGADKWYFRGERYLQVRAPADGSVLRYSTNQILTYDWVNGSEVLVDAAIYIDIGNDCSICFGHISLLKSIYDAIILTGDYSFTEGEVIGYTTDFGGLDFLYYYKGFSICPYPALSSSLQETVSYYFNLQYQRAKLNGVYPTSKLCNRFNIHINDTV
ncbi:MAG: hypothetical protein FK734_04660, partial [Asgard group archaeon]|nr:hypothetical protein [Asgard group archaeon]